MTVSHAPAVTIEPLTTPDLRAVRRIDAASYPEPWSAELWRLELQRAGRCYRLARRNGFVVGFAGALKMVDEAHVLTIATDLAHRRQGIARRLLVAVFDWAIAEGCTALTLEVRASNSGAQALYRAFGMAPAGVRRSYYQPENEDALIFWAHDIGDPSFAERLDAMRGEQP